MNSTPDSKASNPDDSLMARADERLAHAYDQIARADEQLARVTEQLAKMERDAARPPSAGPSPQSPPRRPALRAGLGLLLAPCIVVAALVLQSSYGGGAKLIVARWAPQLVSTPAPPENRSFPAQLNSSTVQVAAAETAPPQATPLAQTAPQDAAPIATPALPDHTELLQTMARDLANVEREIGQLKANQEEMTRLLTSVSEQILPRASLPPTQSTPTSRKPERTVHSPQARARPPRIPREWIFEEW